MSSQNKSKMYESINKNAIKTWIIGRSIASIIIISVYIVGMYIFAIPKFHNIIILKYSINILALIIIVISILLSFIWPFLEYKQWRYGIFEDKIELIKGIIIRKRIIIPISRIQNLKIEQGPIQRIYGITSVNIITAGGCHGIPAITLKEAEKITENLKKIIQVGDENE